MTPGDPRNAYILDETKSRFAFPLTIPPDLQRNSAAFRSCRVADAPVDAAH